MHGAGEGSVCGRLAKRERINGQITEQSASASVLETTESGNDISRRYHGPLVQGGNAHGLDVGVHIHELGDELIDTPARLLGGLGSNDVRYRIAHVLVCVYSAAVRTPTGAESRPFIGVCTDQEWDPGKFAVDQLVVWEISDEITVKHRWPGRGRGAIQRSVDLRKGQVPEAVERRRSANGRGAGCVCHEQIVHRLLRGRVVEAAWKAADGTAESRLGHRTAEKSIISSCASDEIHITNEEQRVDHTIVCKNLGADGLSPGALAEDGDLVRGASKGRNVFIDPPQCKALVPEAVIGDAGVKSFTAAEEAEGRQAIVETDSYHGSSLLYAVLHDEG